MHNKNKVPITMKGLTPLRVIRVTLTAAVPTKIRNKFSITNKGLAQSDAKSQHAWISSAIVVTAPHASLGSVMSTQMKRSSFSDKASKDTGLSGA